jgi:hypothetical protein
MHSFNEVIDVHKATQYLTGAETKRAQTVTYVQQYASDMLAGRWGLSHQGLLFGPPDERGEGRGPLRDGGHRMKAVVLAAQTDPGIKVEFLVTIEDEPDEIAFAGIDGGRNRTTSNLLQINGYKHYTQLASIARRVVLWEAGAPISNKWSPSKLEILSCIERNPGIQEDAAYAHNWGTRVLPPAAVGFCRWLFRVIDADDCSQFLDGLRTGVALSDHSPVHALREQLADGRTWSRYRTRTVEARIALTITYWNKFRSGVEKVQFSRLPNPLTDETFPRPK